MSVLGGMPARRQAVLFFVAALALAMAGCEYTGPDEQQVPAPPPAATQQARSFEENVGEVARLLQAAPSDAGMPSEEEPAGKLSLDLVPGDYMVTGACAGIYGAKLTIVKADGVPEATSFECGSTLDRFLRHDGGPVTISAVSPTGKPSATGVKLQTNPDRRASELEDLSEWSAEQLQPRMPGELRGTSGGNTATTGTLMAEPGKYQLHFVCAGPTFAELSVSTSAGAEVLAAVRVPCDGQTVTAPLLLPAQGADFTMSPDSGVDGRFAYRLVPDGEPTAAPAARFQPPSWHRSKASFIRVSPYIDCLNPEE